MSLCCVLIVDGRWRGRSPRGVSPQLPKRPQPAGQSPTPLDARSQWYPRLLRPVGDPERLLSAETQRLTIRTEDEVCCGACCGARVRVRVCVRACSCVYARVCVCVRVFKAILFSGLPKVFLFKDYTFFLQF